MYIVYITFQAGRPSRVGPYAGPGRGVFYELRVARSDVVSLSLSRRNAASESAKKAVARGSWLVKAHHHSGRAPHVGALTKHGISCPIVGACTWQARYGYVNIMHADICVCFHALRVHHRFRRAALPGRPLRATSYELRTTNNKKALAVVPPIQPNPGYLCLAVYFHTIRSRDSA